MSSGTSAAPAGTVVTGTVGIPGTNPADNAATDPFVKRRQERAEARGEYKQRVKAAKQEYKAEKREADAELRSSGASGGVERNTEGLNAPGTATRSGQ